MSPLSFTKLEKIWMKNHPEINENWVKERIVEDPSILELGELILKDVERLQPGAGRLDVLFQDPDENLRYEVEIQLGKTDENHIIRTIEYWDIERRRYPNYDHVAVIIAEDITSRFLNVISLFNGFIPLIALKMTAYKSDNQIALIFTKILDRREVTSISDEDEPKEITDRSYWEKRGTKATCELTDELLKFVKDIDSNFTLKYNKFYIGLSRNGQAFNFAIFRPQKANLRLEIKLERTDEIDDMINNAGLEVLEYSSRRNVYKLRLTKEDVHNKAELIKRLLFQSYTEFGGEIPV